MYMEYTRRRTKRRNERTCNGKPTVFSDFIATVESLSKGHFGTSHFACCREAVLISEVDSMLSVCTCTTATFVHPKGDC